MPSRAYRENYSLIDWSKDLPVPVKERIPPQRSSLAFPYIASDTMEAIEHPCDGKKYTSKSEFRKTTRANGCIEIGDQKQKPKEKPKPDSAANRAALKRALQKHGHL